MLLFGYWKILVAVAVAGFLFWIMIPRSLFSDPLSTVVYDRNETLLGARIAADGQWRFPWEDSLPPKYKQALIQYEDRHFYAHPGIYPPSILRALYQNIRQGKVVSGGSTLTMQVMRMARKDRDRNILQKIIESVLAVRLELTASKDEILLAYASNAPFGGNVVGLEAASWRYFGTGPHNLSWAESALLAVLPNAPSLIHPGRNREQLKEKRDRLLRNLYAEGIIDSLTCEMASKEPVPGQPLPLPDHAAHLTDHFLMRDPGKKIRTTLRADLQTGVVELVEIHHRKLSRNQVHNLACLVMEVESGNVLAYVGNTRPEGNAFHENHVDVIRAARSTGSILKPFLFAAMLDRGLILPGTLVPDIPLQYDGYSPKNYERGYEGAVPAYQALERSLNVPSVVMLEKYGVQLFLGLLNNLGFTTFDKTSSHYGLSLILGGGETSLWELAGAYGSLARILNHYNRTDGRYDPSDLHMPRLREESQSGTRQINIREEGVLSAGSIYLTFESLLKVNRPNELFKWFLMDSSSPIAWKTGTSFGFRDAWAVGVTPEYLVAVWAGNADGEGRSGLTGLSSAAPLMFDLFDLLPGTSWFGQPSDDLRKVVVCRKSGCLAGPRCPEVDTTEVSPAGMHSDVCPFHRLVHLSGDGAFRVSSACVDIKEMKTENWFVLPPLMEWYYRKKDPSYRVLPPLKEGCISEGIRELEIVYPVEGSMIVIPRELEGSKGKLVMEVAHRSEGAVLFWHMDERYMGSTDRVHAMAADLEPGRHRLTVVDQNGNSETVRFEILDRQTSE